MATTPRISANRLNMIPYLLPHTPTIPLQVRHFQAAAPMSKCVQQRTAAKEPSFMQSQPQPAEFEIDQARRVLGEVIAPWVQDLG